MNDERLARRAAAGDERAFAAIFRRYSQDLYRYCLAIVGNPADAQDALQDTMVKALRSLPGERREINLKPWLYRVAHNEAIDLLRRRRGEELDPETAAPGASLAEAAEERQRLRDLLADLGRLPERQRGALVMRELSGLGFEQIGEAIGASAATARQIVYEARLGLRQMEAGREMRCETVTRAISDGDGRTLRRRDVRAHLRACSECRAFRAGIEQRHGDLAALSPLPAVAVAAVLKGALGAGATGAAGAGAGAAGVGAAGAGAGTAGGAAGAASASGIAGAAAGGSASAAAAGALGLGGIGAAAKVAATVAAVAAIGVGAADRTGLVDVTGAGGEGAAETTPAARGGPPAAAAAARAALPAPAIRASERPVASPPSHPDAAPRGPIHRAGTDGKDHGAAGRAPSSESPTGAGNGKANGKANGHAGTGQARAHGKGQEMKASNGRAAGTHGAPGQGRKASQGTPAKQPAASKGAKSAANNAASPKPDRGQVAPPPKPVPATKAHGAAAPTESPSSPGPPETKAPAPAAAAPAIPANGRPEDDPESSP